MSPADQEILATTLVLPFQVAFLAGVLQIDERRMTAEQKVRAWRPASAGSALLLAMQVGLVSLLVLPIHFFRTRRGWRRLLWPLAILVAHTVALVVYAFFVDLLLTSIG